MIICSPHISIAPESSSGGEVYEREVLKHLANVRERGYAAVRAKGQDEAIKIFRLACLEEGVAGV